MKLITGHCLCLIALALLIAVGLGATAFAQCAPDGLDAGTCCATAQVSLPVFPAISQGIRFICFSHCAPRIDVGLCADLGAPRQATDPSSGGLVGGVYLIRCTIRNCTGGQVLWSGNLRAHYARNWQTTGTPNLGVWRFLLNGDLLPSDVIRRFIHNSCVLPPCALTFTKVYFQGYIDYAQNCATGAWQAAWMVDHECDFFAHGATAARPATAPFHPDESYSFVGPSAGFHTMATGTVPSTGAVIQDSTRFNDWNTLPNVVRFEETVTGGQVQSIREFCPCDSSGSATLQYVESSITGAGTCGSAWSSAAAGGPLPFVRKRIGGWTVATVFPGIQSVFLDMGSIVHRNGCTSAQTTEYVEGVETIGGFPASRYDGQPLGTTFQDLGTSSRRRGAVLIGAPHVTAFLLDVNLP